MSHQSDLISTDINAYLAQHERKELLRFLTCGNVDDGKSTLIGRLLHDSKMIYEDQLAAVQADSAKSGTTGAGKIDLALLVDGLQAERESGDGGERSLPPLRRRDPPGEFCVAVFREVGREEIGVAGGDGSVDAEQAAGVVPAVLDRGDAEVSARAAVHFQVGGGADAADVRLEADPFAFRGFAPGSPDFARLAGVHFTPRSGVNLDAEFGGEFLEAVVEEVAGKGEGGRGEDVFAQ